MEINENKLRQLMEPVAIVLGYDMERLLGENEVRRASFWNQIKNAESMFERQYTQDMLPEERARKASEFTMAKLLLAAAAYFNDEKNPIIKQFSETELILIDTYERNNLFDILSVEEMADRMARRKDIYDLAMGFYNNEYKRLDTVLESPDVQMNLKLAFNQRYGDRINRVVQGVQAYIGKYGADAYVGQVEEAVEKNRLDNISETPVIDTSDEEE